LADRSIIDFNWGQILSKIRLTLDEGNLYSTYGWPFHRFHDRQEGAMMERLVLHTFGYSPPPQLVKNAVERVRRKELMTFLPDDVTNREVEVQLVMSKLSGTLQYMLEKYLSFNYVLIVMGGNSLVWRMCHPAVNQPKSVKDGNPSSISALVQVDNNLELDESAFRLLVEQVKADSSWGLPRELITYEEWINYHHPKWAGDVSNIERLREIYRSMSI